jgi:uncharacterized delta-60 repeat protein
MGETEAPVRRRTERTSLERLEPRRLLAAGLLDTKFSFDGKAISDVNGQYDAANAVAVQADGNIVVAGVVSDAVGFGYIGVFRYLGSGPNSGELDPSFGPGGNGVFVTAFRGFATSIVIQPDGKIVIGGGSTVTTDDFALIRLTSNGRLDPTFGAIVSGTTRAGYIGIDFAGRNDTCQALALQSDGYIIAAGNTSPLSAPGVPPSDFAVARLDPSGTLDNTFSPGGTEGSGRAMINMGGNDYVGGVLVQPNGRILVAGAGVLGANSNVTTVALARLTTTGALDGNFDADGRAYVPTPSSSAARAVALQSENKIVTLGAPDIGGGYMFLSRLNPDGSPAPFPSASDNLLHVLDGAESIEPGGLVVQRDDKILASAYYYRNTIPRENGFVVLRRSADGSTDNAFNGGLPNFVNFGPAPDPDSGAFALALGGDGKIVAAGFTDSGGGITNVAVARFTNDLIAPFNNHFAAVGETMEAEDYNAGGPNVAYFDNTPANTGNAGYRTDEAVDVDNIPGGGRVVNFESDEAVTYAFQVTADASYTLQLRVASFGNARLTATVIRADGPIPSFPDFKSAVAVIPDTGGRFTFLTVRFGGGFHLTPGRYLLAIQGRQNLNIAQPGPVPTGVFLANLDWFKVIPDTFGPRVSFPFFQYNTAPIKLSLTFDEDVFASLLPSSLRVRNLDTGAEFDATGVSYDPGEISLSGEFDVDFLLPTPLDRGNYRVTVLASGVRDFNLNPLDGNGDGVNGDSFTFDFFFLPGDANRDRKVDFNDLVRVAQNYNTNATGYDKADFNYDGRVDFRDLVILAQNYNTVLADAPVASSPSSAAPAALPLLTALPQRPKRELFNARAPITRPVTRPVSRKDPPRRR